MFKERSKIPCDENWNPIPFSEPKYVTVYRLKTEGQLSDEEVAKKLEVSLDTVYHLISYGKNPELYRKRNQEYKRRMKSKRPTNAD